MSLETAIVIAAINGEELSPKIATSEKYKHWISVEDFRRCITCANNHGKIWLMSEKPNIKFRAHSNCRCVIIKMQTIEAGTATINGLAGADWALKYSVVLPEYYISKQNLRALGWKKGKDISDIIKGKVLTKGVYYNANGHLPQKEGREWQEADINYIRGKRNGQRIVWSNDGLIFVTYDHYETFYEIV